MAKKEWPNNGDCEIVYQKYPRKVGHLVALKSISKTLWMLKHERNIESPVPWLTQRVEEYALTVKGKDDKFIPHPATWFNQGRFDDVIVKPKLFSPSEMETERVRKMEDLRTVKEDDGRWLKSIVTERMSIPCPKDWHKDIHWVRAMHYAWLQWRQGELTKPEMALEDLPF